MSDDDKYYMLENQIINLEDFPCKDGWILDFGGGGEGIIGQLKGSQVVAIDRRASELDEALERGSKALHIVMDGNELKFPDNTFSTITAFFSFMYVPIENQEAILKELFRVLSPKGKMIIWDMDFKKPSEIEKKVSLITMQITLPSGKVIKTGYGTKKTYHSKDELLKFAQNVGFKVIEEKQASIRFKLLLQKEE